MAARRLDLDRLPPLPDVARRLLTMDEDAVGTRQVAEWVELDPALAAHVVRHASSPVLGVRERVHSIHEAIMRLGVNKVTELALGLAAGSVFHLPAHGPLGAHDFWRHAVFTAALMHRLAGALPDFGATKPGMAYLAGLLHNIGLLALAHLEPEDFKALNRLAQDEPDTPLGDLERRLGIEDHAHLGARLLRHWRMPQATVVTAQAHHEPHYRGEMHTYANLCNVAISVIKEHLGIGDGDAGYGDGPALAALGLDACQVNKEWETLCQFEDDLQAAATALSNLG